MWAIVLWVALLQAGYAAFSIASEIRTTRTIYLCIESWKIGLHPKACDALLSKKPA